MTYVIEFRSGAYLGFKEYKRQSVRLSWARLFASKKKAERIAGQWPVAGAAVVSLVSIRRTKAAIRALLAQEDA